MPNLSLYKNVLKRNGRTEGEVRKAQSDMIMEQTWNRDLQSKVCYLYDWYHDDEPDKVRDLHPQKSRIKTAIDAKYIVDAYQTMDKDQVTYHIQFRPSQECNVDYYKEFFEERYDTLFPLGLYIDIPDEKGRYNRWLVVEKANYYNPQFITWNVLPCDYKFQWVFEKQKYEMWGVLRSQNSYNSGIWSDYKMTTPEDQQKFIVPLNRDTEKLYHNQRMIIDARVETEPVCWEISKIKRLGPNGLCRITCAQDKFDQHRDYVERDENGKIIGMWADYYASSVLPEDSEVPEVKMAEVHSKITYTGVKPQVKLGGNYKTFTVSFYDASNENIDYIPGTWSFFIRSKDGIITSVEELDENPVLVKAGKAANQLMIALDKRYSKYIKDILVIRHSANGIESEVEMEILSL